MQKLLIQGGATVNALDYDNNTPLHYAFKVDVVDDEPMRDNDYELAYILLEAGADNRLFNKDLFTPFDVAVVDDLTRFGEFLKKKNVTKKYAKKLTQKIRERAMTKRVNKTLVRSRKIPSDLGPLIAEYGAGKRKKTRHSKEKRGKKSKSR